MLREMRTFNLNSALSSPEKSAGVELKAETPSGEGSPTGESQHGATGEPRVRAKWATVNEM